ncbi:hypothetical protein [Cupriavidus pauculus]|uniref:hypothetical protein n=1 Tax=Cupriavidus pauculus TaxID=82633 RepID=UPI001D0C9A46|nr:hypothetical protein [Cupriavidus pauculus]
MAILFSSTRTSTCGRWPSERPYRIIGLMLLSLVGAVWWWGAPYDGQCNSPNGDYYILSRQDWLSYALPRTLGEDGVQRLYDKHHKHLHTHTGSLDGQAGPFWYGKTVIFLGDDGEVIDLPSDGGDGETYRNCY